MELIITGGGSGEDTKEIDCLFASKLNKNKPLLYIPIAIDNLKHPYKDCLAWLKSTFDTFGVLKYEMCTETELKELAKKDPNNYSGIYIGGGNTPYLLFKIKETGFLDFLKKSIKLNIPIYGGSAGALIFSKTILSSLIHDKNWNGISDFNGLNLIGGYDLSCHYSKKERDSILDLIKKEKISNIICLTEKNALLIKEEKITILGKEECIIFNQGISNTLLPGNIIPKIQRLPLFQ